MKKKKLDLQRKLTLQKDVITGLNAAGQGAIQGGSTMCASYVPQEICDKTRYYTCTVPVNTTIGNVSMCNPTELSKALCQTNTGPNTIQPCCVEMP